MKRLLLVVGTAAICVVVAGLAAAPAKASLSCFDDAYLTGYFINSAPAVGSTVSAHILADQPNIHSGSVGAYVGVDTGTDANGGSQYIQVGLKKDHNVSMLQYVAWNDSSGVFHLVTFSVPKYGAAYTDKITNNGNGNWTAQIGSNVQPISGVTGPMHESVFPAESIDNGDGTCNILKFEWSFLSPWTTTQMTTFQIGIGSPYPYLITGGGSGFTVSG
jgi:hypothetical protein